MKGFIRVLVPFLQNVSNRLNRLEGQALRVARQSDLGLELYRNVTFGTIPVLENQEGYQPDLLQAPIPVI